MTDYDDTQEEGNGTTRRRFLGAAAALGTFGLTGTATASEDATEIQRRDERDLPDQFAHVDFRETEQDATYSLCTYEDDPWAVAGIDVRCGAATFGFDLGADALDDLIADLQAIQRGEYDG